MIYFWSTKSTPHNVFDDHCFHTWYGLGDHWRLLSCYSLLFTIDPPGHSRIGGHYFHAWCPSVRPSQKQKRAATDTMCEYNDRLLAVAWWVILNSPDFLLLIIAHKSSRQEVIKVQRFNSLCISIYPLSRPHTVKAGSDHHLSVPTF